jgi:hypothetical protein
MTIKDDGILFQRVTTGLRKPVTRFLTTSGRQVELLSFHLEPGWAFAGDNPRPVMQEVSRRLYPHQSPVIVGDPESAQGDAYLCVAHLFSDTPTRPDRPRNCSELLVCGLVREIEVGVHDIVRALLSQVDWDAGATDDFLW